MMTFIYYTPVYSIYGCGILNIEHGRIEYDGQMKVETIATYYCDRGYILVGVKVRICVRNEERNGIEWTGPHTLCKKICKYHRNK